MSVQLVVTNLGKKWILREWGKFIDEAGVPYFKVGEGGFIEKSGVKEPKDPQVTQTSLDSENDSDLFTYQKSFSEVDNELSEDAYTIDDSDPDKPILEVIAFLDFDEANDDGSGSNPEFFEIGLFGSNDVLLAYGTYPGEVKDDQTKYRKDISLTVK